MLLPAFKLELNNPILRGLVAVGKYDGEHPSLTCATTAGKIFFHSPHEKQPAQQMRFLNINRKISALATGNLDPSVKRDLLLVGAQTTLLAYDVNDNRDLFFKDAPDGVNVVLVGRFGSENAPLALVGGNCSIQGFDAEGNEAFWTVTGDNVSAMTFCDVDEDGELELLVGSDDFEIRVFSGEEVISETTETDRPVDLAELRRHTFAYALVNGTIGCYDKPGQRRWRVKSKHEVTSIVGFDLDGDGQPELISGWANGKFEVRSDRTGEVIFRDMLSSAVAQILSADYRCDGHLEVIVCGADGEVRGYVPMGEEDADGGGLMGGQMEEETLRELQQRKQGMLFELKQYEESIKMQSNGERAAGLLAPDTRICATVEPVRAEGCLSLLLTSSNEARIRAAVVFAERIFQGESHAAHAKTPQSELRMKFQPLKDVDAVLNIKVIAGGRSNTYHVFELTYQLPKFAMYVPLTGGKPPAAGVSFIVRERTRRVRLWLNETFNLSDGAVNDGAIEQGFVSLRDNQPLWIRMSPEGGGTVHIQTENMELAGDVLQDLCSALQITELESAGDFPQELEVFRAVLVKVDECNAVRLHLTAEMADASNNAKTLIVKAEDARILGDIRAMRDAYSQVYGLNSELIGEYNKRANNHEQLLLSLKEVNHMIQKAARLRMGSAKTRVVTACRAAIKANNIHSLFKIIKTGSPAARS